MNDINKEGKKLTNSTLPVLLRNPKILLIGGGSVAFQKAKVLKANNIDFKLISIKVNENIKTLNVNFELKRFDISELNTYNIVIDATGNPEVNHLLKEIKKKKPFLLNSVDVPGECDFYFSSLLQYKNLKIAVSSDGGSPTLTQAVRDKIKQIIPEKIGELSEKKYFEREEGIINVEGTRKEISELFGKVSLIGCGPGDPELITIKALKLIQSADIILHDNLICPGILELAKKYAQIFCVGKQKDSHSFTQDEINNIMLGYAKTGCNVARLKGGDPFVFGRGAEEAEFLMNNNIDVEVVPGISSAFAAPLLAGIPPTMRNYSSSISVVSGHKQDGTANLEWINFLKIKNHTTIVLMGLTKVEDILSKGKQFDIDENLPVAFISNASLINQKVIISTFENLVESSKDVEKPAIIVFGEVINLSEKLNINVNHSDVFSSNQ